MVDLVGRARRARRTLPRNPPHLIGLVRTHDPRREKLVAGKPLEEREMTRIASARWLKELIHRTRIQHLCANLRARLIETRHIRKILAACADRIKFTAARLGFAVRTLQFGPRLKRCVGACIDLRRGPGTRFRKQPGQVLRVCSIQCIDYFACRNIRRLAGCGQCIRVLPQYRRAMF